MKKLVKDYREKTVIELEKEITGLKEEVAKLKLIQRASPVKDTNLLMKKRKQLAALLTVLAEKRQ